jgi:heptosyltransferase II
MTSPGRFVIIQTAFIGDVVLTLPLAQQLRAQFPHAYIAFVAIPAGASLLSAHPALNEVIVYDKRGADRGIGGFLRMVNRLQVDAFDVALVPHRSLRSALLARMSRISTRVGFATSAGRLLMSHLVPYDSGAHEVVRNVSLLRPVSGRIFPPELPRLFPSSHDAAAVDSFLQEAAAAHPECRPDRLIAVAPGSIWATKRWPVEKYAALIRALHAEGWCVVCVGSKEDAPLCTGLVEQAGAGVQAAGRLTLLQSTELLRRCRVLVSNDSAPMHLAVAMRTPVVAIFGATVPAFGFAPLGEKDVVIETTGLTCRPCAIHGGPRCPIGTFVCMQNISADRVLETVRRILHVSHAEGRS